MGETDESEQEDEIRAENPAIGISLGVIWLSATRFRRSYFLCFGGADRMAFARFS